MPQSQGRLNHRQAHNQTHHLLRRYRYRYLGEKVI
jgi:hypothetical protein